MTEYASKIDAFVGDRIRRKRIACGFSANELARNLGVSAEDIKDFETGAVRVGARRLLRLGEIFGVSTSYFFHADESAVADPEPVEAEDGMRLLP